MMVVVELPFVSDMTTPHNNGSHLATMFGGYVIAEELGLGPYKMGR